MFRGQAAFCQSGTDFILGVGGEFLPDFVDAGHVIGIFLFLLKIAGVEIISQCGFAADGRNFSNDGFEQSSFPNTVGTNQRDFLSTFHGKGQRTGKGLVIANDKVFYLEDISAGSTGFFEIEFRLGFFLCQFDDVHFIQFFLTAHCHVSGGNAGFVSGNEVFQVFNFLLLFSISRFQLGFFHFINFLEFFVVAYIAVQFRVFHMVNKVYHTVQERNVVGNEDEGVFVVDEIPFQPFDVVFIQIVGRFVQQKDVRFF